MYPESDPIKLLTTRPGLGIDADKRIQPLPCGDYQSFTYINGVLVHVSFFVAVRLIVANCYTLFTFSVLKRMWIFNVRSRLQIEYYGAIRKVL